MHVDSPTFGQLTPIIEYACQQHSVKLSDRPRVEAVATKILVAIGYFPEDAAANAVTLALMVYRSGS